jgi:hypothetical protein
MRLGSPLGAAGGRAGPTLRTARSAWLMNPAAMAQPWPAHALVFGAARAPAGAACRGEGAQDITGVMPTRRARRPQPQRCGHQVSIANDWPHLGVTARYVYLALGPSNPAATAKAGQAQCLAGLVHPASSSASCPITCPSACRASSRLGPLTGLLLSRCRCGSLCNRLGCVARCTAISLSMLTCV